MKANEPVIMSIRNAPQSVQMINGGSIQDKSAFCQSRMERQRVSDKGKSKGKKKHEAEAEAEDSAGRGWKRRDATRVKKIQQCRQSAIIIDIPEAQPGNQIHRMENQPATPEEKRKG
jgi:hypothetical protein